MNDMELLQKVFGKQAFPTPPQLADPSDFSHEMACGDAKDERVMNHVASLYVADREIMGSLLAEIPYSAGFVFGWNSAMKRFFPALDMNKEVHEKLMFETMVICHRTFLENAFAEPATEDEFKSAARDARLAVLLLYGKKRFTKDEQAEVMALARRWSSSGSTA